MLRHPSPAILAILGTAVLAAVAGAQSPLPGPGGFGGYVEQQVAGYVMKRWTTAEGLPHNWISAVLETRDGFLWLGTNNAGLVRFDGVEFKTFNMLNTPALVSDSITRLYEDGDGAVWIGTASGLVRHRDGVFAAEGIESIAAQPIIDVRADREGRLWVAAERAVVRLDGDAWTVVERGEGFDRLGPSRDGTMWIATGGTLIEWRDREIRRLPIVRDTPGSRVRALLEDRHARLWIATTHGLAHLDPGDGAVQVERTILPDVPTSALHEDHDGTLWIGARNRMFARRPDGTLSESVLESHTQDGGIAVITEDREGHLWFGVEGWRGGLYRLTPERVSMLPRGRLPCDNIGSITEAPDGAVWLATFCEDGKGVAAIRGGTTTMYPGPLFVTALLAEADGTVWAGTYGARLYRFDGARFTEIDVPVTEAGNAVSSLVRHRDGSLWVGTLRSGVLRWRDGQWTPLPGLPGHEVRTVTADRGGAIWIGTIGAVSRYQDGRLTSYGAAEGVPPGPVRAIHVDGQGIVWIGSYGGGLARLQDGRATAYGIRGGVLDSAVHRILEDDDGYLWLTGDRGIRRVSKRDLDAIAGGGNATLDVMLFTEADGMRSAECNGMAQPAGWRTHEGTLYIPTQGGVVRIDPGRLVRRASTPLPRIEEAIVDGVPSAARGELVVQPGYRDVEIRYTAPAFARPDLVQFRYRLEGYHADWVEVGTRRVASFVNLPPGRYRFVVSASNGGEWSAEPAAAVLVLEPYLYQRGAVQIAFGIVAAALAAAGAFGYVRRTHRRAFELERAVAERTSELSAAHDRLSSAHHDLGRAKHEVEQAHGQVLAVLSQLDIGAIVLGPGGIIRYASASALRMLRKTEAALVGHAWWASLPFVDADRPQVKARIDTPSASDGRLPVQMVIAGSRYWAEIDVRHEPPPGDGRILYIYDVAEMSAFAPSGQASGAHGLVGRSTAVHVLYKQIEDVARVDSTVLIEGETGVGKELVARAIHAGSRRAERPFVAVNVAGLTESLLASQLFGHRRGAFTGAVDDQLGVFEAADGGTLFLDEIGDMPPSMQTSLLRVLQEREVTRVGESRPRRVDVRFLAATHRDLTREVEKGRFRQDLLYRIRVARIVVPPLRERLDDVPLLVESFAKDVAQQTGQRPPVVSRETMDALMRHAWPGNVRELKAVIEQSLLNVPGEILLLEHLPNHFASAPPKAAVLDGDPERQRILAALRRAKGNRAEAARFLGMGRTTLYRRLREYGLDSDT